MGTMGLGIEEGLTTTDPGEAYTKKLVMEQARQVVVLADSSKGQVTFAEAGKLDLIDVLITDTKIGARFARIDQAQTSKSSKPETTPCKQPREENQDHPPLSDKRSQFKPFEIDCGKIDAPARKPPVGSEKAISKPEPSPPRRHA
jgi:hypothetical protein